MASCLAEMSELPLRKKICYGLAITYFIFIPIILIALGVPGFIIVIFMPLVLGLPLRYIYKRLVKPFTTPVTVQIGNVPTSTADVENQDTKPDKPEATSPLVTPDTGICGPWSTSERIATIVFVIFVINLFIPSMLVNADITGTEEPLFYSVVGYNLFGSLAILLVVLTLVDIADLFGHAIQFYRLRIRKRTDTSASIIYISSHVELAGSSPPTSTSDVKTDYNKSVSVWNIFTLTNSRRGLKIKALVIFLIYALITAISLGLSYSKPDVIRMDVYIEKLPPCVDGYTVTLVSDVHIGPLVGRSELGDLVDLVNSLDTDIITLVGDIADGTPSGLAKFIEPVRDFSARDGVYVVPGNHEYLHGSTGPEWMATYEAMGLTPLMNARVSLGVSDDCAGFELLGVDDFQGTPSFADAIEGMDGDAVGVVLAHQPNQATDAMAVTEGSIDLMLSGHTHGGQTWPLHLISLLTNDFFAGLNRDEEGEGMWAYVSLGAFGWGPRTRFGSSNNVDVITLKSGAAREDPPVNYTIVWAYVAFPFAVVAFVFCCVCYPGRAIATRQKKQ